MSVKNKEPKTVEVTQKQPQTKSPTQKLIRFEPPVKFDSQTGKFVVSDQWKSAITK
ncbi:hypothetical protein [Pseudobdellovibrio exovorus]|uniref:Uncharacterized protein n=1 Tax=Pseudobdellovibrio exovorus JSS TaxID=1184267 RepID=M4VML2_9BACT|nr:hypothetical protein [Pseudobdellovibrio exovorus]AGH94324.1 hypothetical protein A11Q_104 [Pseudobdellovibrio exovorus JSS]